MRVIHQNCIRQKEDNDKKFLGMNVKKAKVDIYLCRRQRSSMRLETKNNSK